MLMATSTIEIIKTIGNASKCCSGMTFIDQPDIYMQIVTLTHQVYGSNYT